MKDIVEITLINFHKQFPDEQVCFDYLAHLRWNDTPVCPHCGSITIYKFAKRYLYKCKDCQRQFTPRVGTIFEDSRLSLQKWFMAIFLLTSLKKGISSIKLAEYIGTTQKTAWFVLQRVRYAVNTKSFNKPLDGEVEADETYYGGRREGERGRGSKNKTAIFGLAERDGDIKAIPVENVKTRTLVPLIREHVTVGSKILTDEFLSYNRLTSEGYEHHKVIHRDGEFVRRENGLSIGTNHLENFWSHFKRGVDAIYIHVSRKHLGKYCDEYVFRFNTRELTNTERFNLWFGLCSEKRLIYKTLVS